MALFRAAGLLFDREGRLPAILFQGIPLPLIPAAAPDFGVFRLTTGLELRLNLGLLPGLLAGWAVYRRYFTRGRKKKRKARPRTAAPRKGRQR